MKTIKTRNNRRLIWFLLCATTILLIANVGEQSLRVKQLVDESRMKRAVDESRLLNEDPFTPSDIPEALSYIQAHPDYTPPHHICFLQSGRITQRLTKKVLV